MENQTQNTNSSKTTQELTQEQEFTDDNSTQGDNSHILSLSKSKHNKDIPSIRPCDKYDSDGQMQVIQGAYDAPLIESHCKKQNAAKSAIW